MTRQTPNLESDDSGARAGALIERAIERVQSGEHEAAVADLAEAETLASRAGLGELVTAVRINQGWANSVRDDHDTAIEYYSRAAEGARSMNDDIRLGLALANLSVEFELTGRNEQVIETLTEYLSLLEEAPTIERVRALVRRGNSFLETGDTDAAFADLQAAETLAAESEDPTLLYHAQMGLGIAYDRHEDPTSGLMFFERATEIARQLENDELIRDSLLVTAKTNHLLGHNYLARTQFFEVESLCRRTGDPEVLAHALYWFGSTLAIIKHSQEAIAKWTEAAEIRRELGHEGHAADCILMLADLHRRSRQHDAAGPLFAEATEIYSRLGMEHVLASTMYWHGMSRWSGGHAEEALPLVDEALRRALTDSDRELECRIHGLRSMILADLEDLPAAHDELDEAEQLCAETGETEITVWMLARRAYLYAREGRTPDEVTAELSRAFAHAADHDQMSVATSAIRRVSTLIYERCGEEYAEPVRAITEALLAGPIDPTSGEIMPAAHFMPPVIDIQEATDSGTDEPDEDLPGEDEAEPGRTPGPSDQA